MLKNTSILFCINTYLYSMARDNLRRCCKNCKKGHDKILKNRGPDERLGKCRQPRRDRKYETEYVYVEIDDQSVFSFANEMNHGV